MLYCTVLRRVSYTDNGADPAITRIDWPPSEVHVDHSRSVGMVTGLRIERSQFGMAALLMLV